MNASLARVLGLGSRDWTDTATIDDALLDTWHDALQNGYDGIEVIEGGAEGADEHIGNWAKRHAGQSVTHRTMNADWDAPCPPQCPPGHRRTRRNGTTFCPFAGHRRNQDMVDKRPLVALAFIAPCAGPRCRKPKPHDSHGATDCIRRAEKAGIPVRRWTT